ncbi:TetR/AcrR family transcriptional regulator [Desulfosudis oleivorans]|uniref:Transcriptional regulator, TetR family n=1 Tax=Desulfosudis oleivorans (strain DSM 6200 / JCM 39069 / Hxd3) TaxID=96561 RepID=A8ZWL7_DESOH|nr:TetR/AcrR family transcriptional regulator [Desulfosudis oleivorans]ABW68348.1 transcriptional regulator, TetR family [Desulfosudis oleivorans Hxd3]
MPSELTMSGTLPSADGRKDRSRRSKTAIAMALMELIAAGRTAPTAKQIAEQAGVSPRLVFHHFPDMASIYNMMLALQFERLAPLLEIDIPREAPFDKRLAGFVDHRTTLLEFISPTRRAVLSSGLWNAVTDGLGLCRRIKEEQAGRIFGPELANHEADESARRLAGLKTAGSWLTWHTLRDIQGLSADAAGRVMAHMIRSILLFAP